MEARFRAGIESVLAAMEGLVSDDFHLSPDVVTDDIQARSLGANQCLCGKT